MSTADHTVLTDPGYTVPSVPDAPPCRGGRRTRRRLLDASGEQAVPVTRRVAPDGMVVEVDLRGAPFGLGPHSCPGEAHAKASAEGLVAARTR